MTPRFGIRLVALFASVGFACDGSDPGGGASFDGSGVKFDAPNGSRSLDAGARPDVRRPDAIAFDLRPDRPPPPLNMNARLLMKGRAELVGGGLSSCSNQAPASGNGDRWCGFSLPAAKLGDAELWVINVTKAMISAVKCDGTDANCVRLTDKLWTGRPDVGPVHPFSHRFDGDTLIYYSGAPSTNDLYSGPIYAWRPGWKQGRAIISGGTREKGVTCSGHFRAEVAVCIVNITPETAVQTQFDLYAGRISDSDQTLTRIARITPSLVNSTASQWRSGFSRDGQYFAYSTGGTTAAQRETLNVIKVDDIGKTEFTEVGRGRSRWQIALDGKHWYYLSNYNYSTEGDPKGTLLMADFPSGDNETTLAANVGAFLLLNDGSEKDLGVALFSNVSQGKGKFQLLKDVSKPDVLTKVVDNIGSASLSRDLRYTYFSKDFDDATDLSDAYVAKNDGSGASCVLQKDLTTDQYGTPFLEKANMVLWADRIDSAIGVGEGWYTDPATCAPRRKFANGVDFWYPVRDEGLIYSDEGDGETATLRYAEIPDGKAFPTQGGIKVQEQIGRVFSLLLPSYQVGLFSLSLGVPNLDGLYGVTFPFANPTARDGGAPDGPAVAIDALSPPAIDAAAPAVDVAVPAPDVVSTGDI